MCLHYLLSIGINTLTSTMLCILSMRYPLPLNRTSRWYVEVRWRVSVHCLCVNSGAWCSSAVTIGKLRPRPQSFNISCQMSQIGWVERPNTLLWDGSGRSVTDLIQDVVCFTCPYHLSRPLWRTSVISLMPNLWSSETEYVSARSLVPQISGSWRSRCGRAALGPRCLNPAFCYHGA